jgi:hypothetical protein
LSVASPGDNDGFKRHGSIKQYLEVIQRLDRQSIAKCDYKLFDFNVNTVSFENNKNAHPFSFEDLTSTQAYIH